MITTTYKIKGLYTQGVGSLENYVIRATYDIVGTDGTYTATITQSANFTPNAEATEFIAYADLTESVLVEWIKESIGVDGETLIAKTLERMINGQKNPPSPITKPPLPF
jgi:hypothetical protein